MNWISVSERLPEEDEVVLLRLPNGLITGSLDDNDGPCWRIGNDSIFWDHCFNLDLNFDDVSHWMPLPEPPKERDYHKENNLSFQL